MKIQINSDSSVAVDNEMCRLMEADVNHGLERWDAHITRIEIHLSDVNGGKSGVEDKRCLLEARPAGHEPVVASDQAATLHEAVRGATQKMKTLLSSLFGRLEDRAS